MKPGGFPERIWRSRPARILFLAAALLLLTTITMPGPPPPPDGPGDGMLTVSRIRLDGGAAALRFLAGWSLASEDAVRRDFGMHVDNGEVVAIPTSDGVALPSRGAHPLRYASTSPTGPGPAQQGQRDTSLPDPGRLLWARSIYSRPDLALNRPTCARIGGAAGGDRLAGLRGRACVRLATGVSGLRRGRRTGTMESAACCSPATLRFRARPRGDSLPPPGRLRRRRRGSPRRI